MVIPDISTVLAKAEVSDDGHRSVLAMLAHSERGGSLNFSQKAPSNLNEQINSREFAGF
ncbi:hypothetical protein [Streptomyces sp. NPDC006446]|uniref:hypothetical protein n=1 Tax=Streptomyces sp. NPDC006446 TaxID=3154301 RepID=UPI0033A96967